MAEFDSIKIEPRQHVEEIPAHVQYPSLRMNFDNLEKGDIVEISLKITSVKNIIKLDESHKVLLKEYPDDKKVLGRGVLNFVEVDLPPVLNEQVK